MPKITAKIYSSKKNKYCNSNVFFGRLSDMYCKENHYLFSLEAAYLVAHLRLAFQSNALRANNWTKFQLWALSVNRTIHDIHTVLYCINIYCTVQYTNETLCCSIYLENIFWYTASRQFCVFQFAQSARLTWRPAGVKPETRGARRVARATRTTQHSSAPRSCPQRTRWLSQEKRSAIRIITSGEGVCRSVQ